MSLASHIRQSLELPAFVVDACLNDLTEDELFVRPAPTMNHIAWQLGHLISSEDAQMKLIRRDQLSHLPEGFAAQHSKEAAVVDDPACFRTKPEYLALMGQQREHTLQLLARLTDEELEQPCPDSIRYFGPTIGCVFSGQAVHWMMHAGQWMVIRRKLGKPLLF